MTLEPENTPMTDEPEALEEEWNWPHTRAAWKRLKAAFRDYLSAIREARKNDA